MKLSYFWSSDEARKPIPGERNEGIEAVPGLLRQLAARGADVEFVDTAQLTEKARIESYSRVVVPAVYRHYEVKRMLGTNRHSGCLFGAEVPALLVTNTDSAGDTYPHRKGHRITTIHSFLADLLAQG
jgi:menaquinone-dependent protoporphyrinogen IX oxidase